MAKRLLIILLFFSALPFAKAQLPDPCPSNTEPPNDICESACIYCNFNGITSSTSGYSGQTPPGGYCGTIENEQWLGFIAGAAAATFTATPSNCNNGNGVQIALYSSCSGTPVACNGGSTGNGNTPVSITATLTPGANYFLLVDGYGGDQCDFQITVTPPSAVQAPNVGAVGVISGPPTACPGATVTYQIPAVTGAGIYEWTSTTPGVLFNGQSPPVQIPAPGGRTVEVTFPLGVTGNIQICVQPLNSCNTGNKVCRTINVQPIAPTILTPVVICFEDAPYELPWGTQVNSSGNYSTTYTSWQGCDSVVRQQVTVKQPIVTNLGLRTICAGNTFNVCDPPQEFTSGGPQAAICESWQGCDSTVNFNLVVLDVNAEILPPDTISCSMPSVVLNSAPTNNGNKFWRNSNGTIIGTSSSVTVTSPGLYTLTVSATIGGVTCSEVDTVQVLGNTTPPTASATGATIGCATSSVSISATTNASPATFSWSGPGGFTSTSQNPSVTLSGTYTVTVTNPANGCTATATATVMGSTTPPGASATGTTLSCAVTSSIVIATSPTADATFSWSGPGGASGTNDTLTINTQGTYTVTVTSPSNGCTSTATATVNLNNTAPTGTAAASSNISCTTPMPTLNLTTNGTSFNWSGPGGFTSNLQNPAVQVAGLYTVVVTGSNGCTATTSVTVDGNTTPPTLTATGGTVSCATTSIVLQTNTNATNPTFSWTGPGGFTSNAANPSATQAGGYNVTVTNSANNCTATQAVTVNGDFAVPNAGAVGGTISCSETSVPITGSSSTPGATFSWAGPGNFSSSQAVDTVNTTGLYTLTVTGPNGCTTTATADVLPDANVPNASASGGLLNCTITSTNIIGSSTTPGVSLSWTGPNGFTSTNDTVPVNAPGTFILTVTNPNNGCTAQATAVVTENITPPGASAEGDTLTCAQGSVTLSGASPTNNVTWSWSAPGFTSNLQNPSVTVADTYSLTVTGQNGCTSTATAVVSADVNAPVASTAADTLTCAVQSIVIDASSTLSVTYAWTGPNGFTSNLEDPSVTLAGDYTVTVTAGNGCTDSETITVQQDISAPNLTATGGILSCAQPQTIITAASITSPVSFSWSGQGLSSTSSTPTVQTDGDYTVTATGANGCTSSAVATVTLDTEAPTLAAQPADVLTCTIDTSFILADIATGSSTLQSISWSGPNGFSSSDEDPQVVAPGLYTLVVTSANGCTSTVSAVVDQNIATPNASASGGILTCTATSLTLTGDSNTPGVTFSWIDPGGVSIPGQNPNVSSAGDYTLVVTALNGCTSTALATVSLDANVPDVSVASSNNLFCDSLTTSLTASSSVSGVTYTWSTGDAGIPAIQVSQPGNYFVTVTAPNSCTSVGTVAITQDTMPPGAFAIGDTTDCISGTGTLTGSSPASNVIWEWTGPNGFTSTEQNPNASNNGVYTLTVTGDNGCTSSATASIVPNTDAPQVTVTGGGTLTCAVTSLPVTATIITPNATGIWTLPDNTTSTINNFDAIIPGDYTFEVTASNGCITTESITFDQDTTAPQGVTTAGGQLTCTNTSLQLSANSTTPGVTYAWTSPDNIGLIGQNPVINLAGLYTLTITDPSNGCTTVSSALVTSDPTSPTLTLSAVPASAELTCTTTSIDINLTTNTADATYSWQGPGTFTSTQANVQVITPGTYRVTITNPANGCTAANAQIITQDIALPGASAVGDTITCQIPTAVIAGSSPTAGVTFVWTTPDNNTLTGPIQSVTNLGTYILTVTGTNGCTSTASALVAPDASIPQLTVTGGTVTCADSTVQILATSSITNVTWAWTGPLSFTSNLQNPVATIPGGYSVTAVAPNGCSSTAGTTLIDNTDSPALDAATPDQLTCATTQVGLSVSATTPGNHQFSWTTVDGTIVGGSTSPTPQVSQAGIYTVVVENILNGCTAELEVVVEADSNAVSGLGVNTRNVSCFGDTDGSAVVTSVQGGTAPYLFSFDNQPFSTNLAFNGLQPGTYSLMVQDANGCEFETQVVVDEPDQLFLELGQDTTIRLGDSIDLNIGGFNTNIDPADIAKTVVTPAYLLQTHFCDTCGAVTLFNSVRYQVTIIDSFGCKASDERLILVDKTRHVYIPNVFSPSSVQNNIFTVFGGRDVVKIRNLAVYDRWGSQVFLAQDIDPLQSLSRGWNGRVNGKIATPAVFVYYAEIEFIDGEVIIYKGDVALME